jgi:hypothetical protein
MQLLTESELGATRDHRVERLVDQHMVEVTTIPRGRKGLWGALADVAAPRLADRALPLTDAMLVGTVAVSMFDYDPAIAVRLEPA